MDVAGLQVPVHHSLRVGEGEPVADLLHDAELLRDLREGPLLDELPEVGSLEQLHRHVDRSLLLAEVIDGDDVRVIEVGGGLGLLLEALTGFVVAADAFRDGLDGDEAPEHRVVGLVDLAHGPLADLAQDFVLADLSDLAFLVGQHDASRSALSHSSRRANGNPTTRSRPGSQEAPPHRLIPGPGRPDLDFGVSVRHPCLEES